MKLSIALLASPLLGLASLPAAELAVYVPSGGKAAAVPINADFASPMVKASSIDNIIIGIGQGGATLGSGSLGPVRDASGSWKFDSGAWLFANSLGDANSATPSCESKYFAFSITAQSTAKLKLEKLCFEYAVGQNTDIPAASGNFYYAVYASVNGAAFQQIGKAFDSGKLTLAPNTSTLLGTQTRDLSQLKDVQRVEFRVWVGSTVNLTQAGSLFQNIVVHGSNQP